MTQGADTADFDWRRAIANNRFAPRDGIDDFEAVRIGGIDQWINVRGSHRDNPLLFFLHGGPGYPMMAESWTFQRPWEDFFTVVHWDQRGAGKTFAAAGLRPDPALSIEQLRQDAEEVIDYLLRRYGKHKLFLLGHSWGSVLGMQIARDRPELLHAYIGVGQMIDARDGEAVSYRLTLEKARVAGHAEAIGELEAISPYACDALPSVGDVMIERRWVQHFGGMIHSLRRDDEVERWRMSPLYDDHDVTATVAGAEITLDVVWPQLAALSFRELSDLDCPLFLFAGCEDLATPTTLVESFFERVSAPVKRFFEYPAVAHYPFNEAPGQFLLDLVQHVRPLAGGQRLAMDRTS